MPATRIDPIALSAALATGSAGGRLIGVDAMRYYLLREVPLGNDGDFTFESLFGRFNAELANDLGNLINRSLTLVTKFALTVTPKRDQALATGPSETPHAQLEAGAVEACRLAAQQFELIAPSRALEQIWKFVGVANRYIDQTQPWALAKANDPALAHVLWSLQASLWVIARLVAPVLPETTKVLRSWLGDTGELAWPTAAGGRVLDQAPATLVASVPSPLFPRLDEAAQTAILTAVVGDAAAPALAGMAAAVKASKPRPPVPEASALAKGLASAPSTGPAPEAAPADAASIGIADFARIDLRVGRVLTAVAVPKAKKLLHLAVDLGEAQPRSIVAGIAEAYTPDALVGKQVIVVANLAPVTLRGIRSEGMILAAGGDAIVGLSALDRDVPPGTRIR